MGQVSTPFLNMACIVALVTKKLEDNDKKQEIMVVFGATNALFSVSS